MQRTLTIAAVILAVAWTASDVAAQDDTYLTPPPEVAQAIDASTLATPVVSPKRDVVALVTQNTMPPMTELSEPMLRLGGMRINPRTNGSHFAYRYPTVRSIVLKRIADGRETAVKLPADGRFTYPRFSPDGTRLSLVQATDRGLSLWQVSVADGTAKAITESILNGTWGEPCQWLDDGRSLLCRTVPSGRGAVPAPPAQPKGPTVQQHAGKPAPVRTNQDLLTSAYDDALFEHYFTSQLAYVDAASGQAQTVGTPALFERAEPSPNGEFILVSRIKKPFSRLVPAAEFGKDVEILNRQGARVALLGALESAEGVKPGGVRTGARWVEWNPVQPAAVAWVEALDGGDPAASAPRRDKVLALAAPFTGAPRELATTEHRFQDLAWSERGTTFLVESDRKTRTTRTWVLGSGAPRKLFDRKSEDRYADPGRFVGVPGGVPTPEFGPSPDKVVMQTGSSVFLAGEGASPEGDRPFLDRLDLDTQKTERLFRSDTGSYESVLTVLTADGRSILTKRETPTSPANVMVRDTSAKTSRALTAFTDPVPALSGAQKQLLTYKRKDGVSLSATLYVPKDRKGSEKLPMVLWAYPREFADPGVASQVVGSPYRYTPLSFGDLHLIFLLRGYAVMIPAMPIVGPGETANDNYVEQLVASAEAAIDKAVEVGVADRERIGVAGHSYGAFMTANLLAHSDLFKAGIALSGAYNRTLTPFGFQNERRTFWEVPELYGRMSPFWHAQKVNEPILLLHGDVDNNQGTFPIQSERFYMALKGHGTTVRYVVLPNESHRYAARETLHHVAAEYLLWFDKYVKGAGRKETSAQ
jgi:dipeptidyl aminopeptidase/acylaminoacyl peptidase